MSREPTEEDVTLALRLGTSELKKDIAEAKRDLKHFLDAWAAEFEKAQTASAKLSRVKRDPTATAADVKDASVALKGNELKVKMLERYVKYTQQIIKSQKLSYDLLRAVNVNLRKGGMHYKEMAKDARMVVEFEKKLNKEIDKRVKKQAAAAKKKAKATAADSKGFVKDLTNRMRLYTVMSSRGMRMIATMRGAAGAIIGALGVVGQFALQQVQKGIQALMRYEQLSRQIAFTQVGQTGGDLSGAYGQTLAGLTSPGGLGVDWSEIGVPRMEGAQLELMALKSDLEFTEQQMKDIALSASFAGEESGQYFQNLVNWIRMFRIEADDYDDIIAMFATMSGQILGGSAALGQGLDYFAGVALEAGWDPRQFMVIQQEVEESGHDASKFMRGFGQVLNKIIKDNTLLDGSIRGIDGSLRGLDEVIWTIYDSYTRHEGFVDSSAWALENFGTKGAEVVSVLMTMIDAGHDFSTLMNTVNDTQEVANNTLADFEGTVKDTLILTMNDLNTAIEDFQMSLAKLIAPALTRFLKALTDVTDWLTWWVGLEDTRTEEERDRRKRWADTDPGAYYGVVVEPEGTGTPEQEDEEEPTGFFNPPPVITDDCGRLVNDPAFGQPCVKGVDDDEIPFSPVVRKGGSGLGGVVSKRTTSSSVVNHNYITVVDNDSLVRELLGANINV